MRQNARIIPAVLAIGCALFLTGCGQTVAADGPKDAVIRAAERSERTGALTECLEARGWPVSVDEEDTRITIGIPREQEELYDADVRACGAELGIDTNNPVSDEQLEILYAELNKMGECLEAEGYPVSEAPSLQTFIDMSNNLEAWGPWMDIPPSQVIEAMDNCPQPPPVY